MAIERSTDAVAVAIASQTLPMTHSLSPLCHYIEDIGILVDQRWGPHSYDVSMLNTVQLATSLLCIELAPEINKKINIYTCKYACVRTHHINYSCLQMANSHLLVLQSSDIQIRYDSL